MVTPYERCLNALCINIMDSREVTNFSALTDEEWKKRLTPEQYAITRKKGTERAFSGFVLMNSFEFRRFNCVQFHSFLMHFDHSTLSAYWKTKSPGVYECICCGTPLFE